jgi:hypothetical protein
LGRITKGERVRRWVMDVPIPARSKEGGGEARSVGGSSAGREVPLDKDEVEFDMDREVPADKDTQLFTVADNLIKSHLARVDVPLLGVLSFDESESESEEEDFMDYEDEEGEEDYDEEEEKYEEEDEGDETGDEDEGCDDQVRGRGRGGQEELASASKDAELGTTTDGTRQHSRGSVL